MRTAVCIMAFGLFSDKKHKEQTGHLWLSVILSVVGEKVLGKVSVFNLKMGR